MVQDRHHALAREAILAALTAYTGITTADGATPANNTLIDANLIGRNDFVSNKTILIGSGDADDESSCVLSLATDGGIITDGIITVTDAFNFQIKKGIIFRILHISIGDLAAIEAQIDKLAGETPVSASTTANWNTAEADVVSIGADGTKYKLHSLVLSIHNLAGTTITVRMYMQVKGAERKVYEQAFDATTDPPGLWIVNGTLGIHEVLRVTLQSNNAADNGQAVDYDYMLEAM